MDLEVKLAEVIGKVLTEYFAPEGIEAATDEKALQVMQLNDRLLDEVNAIVRNAIVENTQIIIQRETARCEEDVRTNYDPTLDDVRKFCVIMNGYKLKNEPDFTNKDDVFLRLKLVLEEVFELIEAAGFAHDTQLRQFIADKIFPGLKFELAKKLESKEASANPIEVLDALCDLRYVLDGAAVAFGLDTHFKAAFNLVHRNNMNKVLVTHDAAKEHAKQYWETEDVAVEIVPLEYNGKNVYLLKCIDDPKGRWATGKILKPFGFKSVNLKTLF